ncbi:MAG: ATP-binding cassette domain-containing protein [Methylobacteriaceae bacterium]|jgi:simple sugar transport system ATP-binding protein|nr:ATP-binding cassette domain-containing protein [Methylobacteriaceae bacterium]
MASKPPPLRIDGIGKSYNALPAVHSVSLTVGFDEILGIVGADSSGKSTLSRIICGLETADEGDVFVNGRWMSPGSPDAARRLGVELVDGAESLSLNLDVAHNIFLGRYPLKFGMFIDKTQMYRKTRALLDGSGLADISGTQKLGELSGGMRQIIAIIRAISFDPKVLILDEPTRNLSQNVVSRFDRLLLHMKNRHVAQIFTTRRPAEAIALCDRIIVMRHGRIVREGPARVFKAGELATMMMSDDE